jgi:gibberellin 2-oxidase
MHAWLPCALVFDIPYNCSSVFSCALADYTGQVQKVVDTVLTLVSQGLGLEDTGVFSRMVRRDGSDEMLRVNHYPPAMRAEARGGAGGTTGFGEHTDPQIISVLRSNSVPGLQIALPDGRWLPVQHDPEALFVNVGDAMQVNNYRRAC